MAQTVAHSSTLRTQRIVGVRSVALRLGWLVVGPLMLTVVGILLAVPLMEIFTRFGEASASRALKAEADSKFRSFIGRTPRYFDVEACGYGSHLKKLSAAGMAYADGRLYVLEEGVAAEIPWDMIRSWKWNIDGASQTELYGNANMGTQLQVGAANQTARAIAHRASGFTVTTADVDKPEWRYQTTDEKVLKRWMEILTQMNEGRLERA